MKWRRISVETTNDYESLIADMLCEKGFDGIEMIDNKQLSDADVARMFIDIPPELDESDTRAVVNCYIEMDEDIDEKLALVNEGLEELSFFMDISDVKVSVSETEDKDWMNNWKEFFKPFRIDESIVIKPTWEELTDVNPGDMVIQIDPGTAFGTGAHETTKLCILAIKKYLKAGDVVLDVGCGSGILSIASKMLGASMCIGTDIDENAVNVSFENAEVNSIETVKNGSFDTVEGKLNFVHGNVISDDDFRTKVGKNKFDIVVANILADIIMPLSDVVRDHMKPGALFISSGILATREAEVKERLLSNGFGIVDTIHMGDWVSIIAK